MIDCPTCGAPNAASFGFCLDCGKALPRPIDVPSAPVPVGAAGTRRCERCGASAPPGFAFCGGCGTRLPEARSSGTPRLFRLPAIEPPGRLVLLHPDGSEEQAWALDEGREILLGSGADAIRIPDDPFLSPRHCRFLWRDGGLHVEDLGSLNGIFRRIRGEAPIEPHGQIRIGRQLLRLEPMPPPPIRNESGIRLWGSPDPGYRARLVQLLEGGGVGEVFPLRRGDNLVGREQGDAVFPSDPSVSPRHAVIRVEEDGFRLRNLGSAHGTFVRLRQERIRLEAGDQLLVGRQLLRVDLSRTAEAIAG